MALSKQFGALLDITLVESEEIGTVGVGESTVPPITTFHNLLGIDEREFMRECAATFKVAIWFEDFGKLGDWYLHPFGRHGQPTWVAEFYNHWLQARSQGLKVPLGEYCYEWLAAVKDKFALRENPRVNYAYHFDAALYARYMRRLAEGAASSALRARSSRCGLVTTATSNRSSSKTAASSPGISSSTARDSARC